jgi:adenosine deaminase
VRDLTALPKTDLHVHLEGSIRPRTLVELADRNGAPLPDTLADGRYSFADFAHFITTYTIACECLRRPEDFRRIAYEFCEDEAAQGVRYAEPSFSMELDRVTGGLDEPLEAVLGGLTEGGRDFGIAWGLCVDVVRGIPIEDSRAKMRAAVRHADRGVVSIGLGGSERFGPQPYADIFAEATAAGLHSVPHAGEAAGAESIWGAITALRAERIGHGIRCLEDATLVDELRERAIPLDVCPTSNVVLGMVRSVEEHPLPRLMEAGLTVTINSDDPAMLSSPVAGEFETARTVFGMDDDRLAALARAGVRSSFADRATKDRIERGIDDWLERG